MGLSFRLVGYGGAISGERSVVSSFGVAYRPHNVCSGAPAVINYAFEYLLRVIGTAEGACEAGGVDDGVDSIPTIPGAIIPRVFDARVGRSRA